MNVICVRSNVGQQRLQAGQLSQLDHGPFYALVVLASTGDLASICTPEELHNIHVSPPSTLQNIFDVKY